MATADSTVTEFKKHVQRYITKYDCYGCTTSSGAERVEFVPRDALEQFWTVEAVRAVLWSDQLGAATDTQHLIETYLIVFSILVWMGKPGSINMMRELNIDDQHLPVDDKLIQGTEQPDLKELLLEFSKYQWKFCPLILEDRPFKRQLHAYHIVPIVNKELLDPTADDENGDVQVYKAQWHKLCLGSLPPSFVVLKEYRVPSPDSDAYKMLSNEVDMYIELNERAFDYIVKYYGSIVQQGKFTLILEFASEGSLLNYFENTPHPPTGFERVRFWQRFFHLLHALTYIHQLCKFKGNVLKGVHQDIRPQNILVFPGPEGSLTDVRFKLADFGTGHVRKCRDGGLDSLAAQRAANGMYSSPESYRDHGFPKPQSAQCDIWSLGAVASEALVWSIQGEDGRRRYQDDRCTMTQGTPLKGGFHEGGFHDGTCRLPIVGEKHQAILKLVDNDDPISAKVSDIILNGMLVADPQGGSTAEEIFHEWKQTYENVGMTQRSPRISQNSPVSPRGKRISMRRTSTRISTRRGDSTNPSYSYQSPTCHEAVLWDEPGNIASPLFSGVDRTATCYSMRCKDLGGETGQSHQRSGSPGSHGHRASGIGSIGHCRIEDHTHVDADPSDLDGALEIDDGDPFFPDKPPRALKYSTQTFHQHYRPHTPSKSSLPEPLGAPPQLRSEPNMAAVPQGSGLNIQTPARNSAPAVPQPPRVATNPQIVVPQFFEKSATITSIQAVPSRPVITIDDVYTKYIKPKDKTLAKYWPGSKALFARFPSLQKDLHDLKGYGNGRDQFFIIDDSSSMKRHKEQMGKTVRVLAHLLKVGKVDPNKKMELYYTCERGQQVEKNSSEFQKKIEGHTFSDGPCNIFQAFGEIATEILQSNGNGNRVSIYILTNGRWNAAPDRPDDLCKVDRVIKRFLTAIENGGKESNHVGIQFIRFYKADNPKDEAGLARLRFLDDNLAGHFKETGLDIAHGDIVDTTDWDGDVGKMLLGSVRSEMDG